MKDRKMYRVFLGGLCFVFSGIKLYQLVREGEYPWQDVFITVALLLFGLAYIFVLNRKEPE